MISAATSRRVTIRWSTAALANLLGVAVRVREGSVPIPARVLPTARASAAVADSATRRCSSHPRPPRPSEFLPKGQDHRRCAPVPARPACSRKQPAPSCASRFADDGSVGKRPERQGSSERQALGGPSERASRRLLAAAARLFALEQPATEGYASAVLEGLSPSWIESKRIIAAVVHESHPIGVGRASAGTTRRDASTYAGLSNSTAHASKTTVPFISMCR